MPITPDEFYNTMEHQLIQLNHYHKIQNKTMEKQLLKMYETFLLPVVLKNDVYVFDFEGTVKQYIEDEKETAEFLKNLILNLKSGVSFQFVDRTGKLTILEKTKTGYTLFTSDSTLPVVYPKFSDVLVQIVIRCLWVKGKENG